MQIIPNWHPLLVHFTLVLIVTAGMLQCLLWLFKMKSHRATLLQLQRWLIPLCAVSLVATLAAGIQAYYTVAHDAASHVAMTNHRNWAFVTAAVFAVGTLLFYTLVNLRQSVVGVFWVSAMILVAVTSFKGGEVVFRYGIGVMALPQVTSDGHDHAHGSSDNGAPDVVAPEDDRDHAHDSAAGSAHEPDEHKQDEHDPAAGEEKVSPTPNPVEYDHHVHDEPHDHGGSASRH